MRSAITALEGLKALHPDWFPKLDRVALFTKPQVILTPPMMLDGDVLGTSLSSIIVPETFRGVPWGEVYSEIAGYLADDIDFETCFDVFAEYAPLNAKQREWLLPHKSGWNLLALILWGWVRSGQAKVTTLNSHTLMIRSWNGGEYGIKEKVETSTTKSLAMPNSRCDFKSYLQYQRRPRKGSSSLWVNALYRNIKRSGGANALAVVQALIWNSAHLSHADRIIGRITDPDAPRTKKELLSFIIQNSHRQYKENNSADR